MPSKLTQAEKHRRAAARRMRMRLEAGKLYANFDETEQCFIYIGGRYYDDSAQIHLSREEAEALRDWLVKRVKPNRALLAPKRKKRGKKHP